MCHSNINNEWNGFLEGGVYVFFNRRELELSEKISTLSYLIYRYLTMELIFHFLKMHFSFKKKKVLSIISMINNRHAWNPFFFLYNTVTGTVSIFFMSLTHRHVHIKKQNYIIIYNLNYYTYWGLFIKNILFKKRVIFNNPSSPFIRNVSPSGLSLL